MFSVGFLIGLFKWCTDFPTTWSLGCAISSFVASTGWKYKHRINNNPIPVNDIKDQVQDEVNAVSKIFEYSWNVLHPLIFGLIGMELNYECFVNKNHDIVFTGIIIITVVIVVSTPSSRQFETGIPIQCIIMLRYLSICYCHSFNYLNILSSCRWSRILKQVIIDWNDKYRVKIIRQDEIHKIREHKKKW